MVACGLGKLYNKEAVIEALLDRSKMPHDAAHIKSLKVGITLIHLHVNTRVCVCVKFTEFLYMYRKCMFNYDYSCLA